MRTLHRRTEWCIIRKIDLDIRVSSLLHGQSAVSFSGTTPAMPPARVWFAALYGFITAATGALLTAVTQLAGTSTSIAGTTWLVILATGLASAAAAGKAAWPTESL
jgi:hypothetical protein